MSAANVSAWLASSTSRPVTFSTASALPRIRLSTSTVSAAPATPCVPDTSSRKSAALALRVWWTITNGTPYWSATALARHTAR